ncbi:cytochrome c peroxidase [Paraphysoderma sedebokerense]|nr:cytochrome c peroxidase [Paraphysoderma sedebokerense]
MTIRFAFRSLTSRVANAAPSALSKRQSSALPFLLRRSFATTPEPAAKKSSATVPLALGLAAIAAGGYYFAVQSVSDTKVDERKPLDYKAVAHDIAEMLDNNDYDDGSLAWHAAGTYSKHDNTGGSWGGTMRFNPESVDGANAGLGLARDLLEKLKKKYPGISYGDLWTLAGVVAIKELGGPSIPWRAGRKDAADEKSCPPVGRLPDASKDSKHVREVFNRMGFEDREIVLGRCHPDRSGYVNPWTFNPTTFTNDYFKLLLSETWQKKKWDGPLQYEDKKTKTLMMLPSDMWLIWDKQFKKHVEEFAKDEAAFFQAFASAFGKLLELGCKFEEGTKVYNH